VGKTFNSVFYPPQANLDVLGVTENTTGDVLSPLLNDGGSALSLTSVSETDGDGTATPSGANVSFTPTANFVGTATINYTVTDDMGNTSNSIILVTVTNIPPLANPDSYSVLENSANNVFNPLTNDVLETSGGTLSLSTASETDGNGSVSQSGNQVLFTPTTSYAGPATINYVVSDGIGGSSAGVITVNVVSPSPIPLSAFLSGNTNLIIAWTNAAFKLQVATNVAGPYVTIPGASSPYTNLTTTNAAGFFRLLLNQ
jgi:hypothetical protein